MFGRANTVTGILALTALVVGIFSTWLVHGFAAQPLPAEADAIIALAGSDVRARTAVELFDAGRADELVLSAASEGDDDPRSATARRVCGSRTDTLTCFDPVPPTTRGEAMAIGELARERGWDQVILVTSDYHARRAAMNVQSCLDAALTVVPVEDTGGPLAALGWTVHEVGGLLDLLVRPPRC